MPSVFYVYTQLGLRPLSYSLAAKETTSISDDIVQAFIHFGIRIFEMKSMYYAWLDSPGISRIRIYSTSGGGIERGVYLVLVFSIYEP